MHSIGLVLSANLASALASNFTMLLVSRVLVGISIGGFWAIAASLGPRLAGNRYGSQATAIIFGGVAVASLVGVPLGTALGDAFGWRLAFGGIGLLGRLCRAVPASYSPGHDERAH